MLLGPAIAALAVLIGARFIYPQPREFETRPVPAGSLPRTFWLYLAAVGLIAAGYADFPLIAFHFRRTALVPDAWIPVFYAAAMGVDAIAVLIFGRLFDHVGVRVLAGGATISAFAAPLAFSGRLWPAAAGMILWGIGMGAQESVMRAAVADMVPAERRGAAYGLFNSAYGLCWFAGSALMGAMYGSSVSRLVVFSLAAQLAGAAVLVRWARRR